MNRPGYACLTCTTAICDGCPGIPCTREERALLRMALPKAYIEKKEPAAAEANAGNKKDLRLKYNTTQGGFTT